MFTWNAEKWAWDDPLNGYLELQEDIKQTGRAYCKWTCGRNKSIQPGDRIFLIKLGSHPKGIVASGNAATGVFEGSHWSSEKRKQGIRARRVFVEFDTILDYNKQLLLSLDKLEEISSRFNWTPQTSGIEIPNIFAYQLEKKWRRLCIFNEKGRAPRKSGKKENQMVLELGEFEDFSDFELDEDSLEAERKECIEKNNITYGNWVKVLDEKEHKRIIYHLPKQNDDSRKWFKIEEMLLEKEIGYRFFLTGRYYKVLDFGIDFSKIAKEPEYIDCDDLEKEFLEWLKKEQFTDKIIERFKTWIEINLSIDGLKLTEITDEKELHRFIDKRTSKCPREGALYKYYLEFLKKRG